MFVFDGGFPMTVEDVVNTQYFFYGYLLLLVVLAIILWKVRHGGVS